MENKSVKEINENDELGFYHTLYFYPKHPNPKYISEILGVRLGGDMIENQSYYRGIVRNSFSSYFWWSKAWEVEGN